MRHFTVKHVAFAIAAFAATTVALLWSWNTLAALIGGPTAEFKHVLAAMIAAAVLRGLVTSSRRRPRHLT